MRIMLIAALVSSVAVAGCGGGEKNSSTSANNSASGNVAAAGGAGGGNTGDAFRRMVINQCETSASQLPNAPPGVNAGELCNCAVETALGDQADPVAFARTPEGQQALTQAIVACARPGGAAAANKAGESK